MIVRGDCIEVMAGMDSCSVDAIVTDPPYGLEFMGKEWDKFGKVEEDGVSAGGWEDGGGGNPYSRSRIHLGTSSPVHFQAWTTQWAVEALRVLKPGGTSGDPCQPFSVAGKRLGEADERYVWDDVARIIREVSPRFVFLENVAGAIEFRHGCRADLEGMGYRVEAGLFSAEEVGAPHQRVRVFLLAENPLCVGLRGRDILGDSGGVFCEVQAKGLRGSLAHSESRHESPGTEPTRQQRSGAPAESGGELGDPRLCDGSAEQGRECEVPRSESGAASSELAHSCGPRTPPWRPESATRGEGNAGVIDHSCLPLFPPGPADLDTWREVLRCWPELEPAVALPTNGQDGQTGIERAERDGEGQEAQPAIRRMADGPSNRNDRLRALGNAVVPATAALAFATLWGRLRSNA